MPLFGAHMSIAGGYFKAADAARVHACESLQLFTKNSNQWRARDILDRDVEQFREALESTSIRRLLAHDSYLINLASPDAALYRRSVDAFAAEVQRAERLGLDYLVTHPGCHMGSGEEKGLERVAQALSEVHRRCPRFRVQILLETTAGQGSSLGYRFEHMATILEKVKGGDRLGICLDTCHVFASGYRLAPRRAYEALAEFNNVIGLERLKAFHLNDSKKPLGSRVDRHAHIGRGLLGLESFALLVNDRRFREHPMILETPKESADGQTMDAVNLSLLRGLLRRSKGRVHGRVQ